ncbi:MAG: PspC domain-containing protein [Opitutales bacterium]|nr:PspC domain-containing protein [Opitutales bacterium]
MNRNSHTLYRSRNGVIFGVLQGIADHFGLNIFWLRVIAIILFLASGFFPIVLMYIVAALLMKPEPVRTLSGEDEEFYNSFTSNRKLALSRLSGKLDTLDRRARRIEDIVTARGYDWDRRMRENG